MRFTTIFSWVVCFALSGIVRAVENDDAVLEVYLRSSTASYDRENAIVDSNNNNNNNNSSTSHQYEDVEPLPHEQWPGLLVALLFLGPVLCCGILFLCGGGYDQCHAPNRRNLGVVNRDDNEEGSFDESIDAQQRQERREAIRAILEAQCHSVILQDEHFRFPLSKSNLQTPVSSSSITTTKSKAWTTIKPRRRIPKDAPSAASSDVSSSSSSQYYCDSTDPDEEESSQSTACCSSLADNDEEDPNGLVVVVPIPHTLHSHLTVSRTISNPCCSICLTTYQVQDTIVVASSTSSCTHVFHETCLYDWWSTQPQQRLQCPICRQCFVE